MLTPKHPSRKRINQTERKIKKRDRVTSTQKLLQAGLAVFSEVGYDAATTKAISIRAGLNESLIQRYFEGKAGLLAAVIVQYADKNYLQEYPIGKTPEEEVFNYLKTRFETDSKNPDLVRVAFHRIIVDPTFMKSLEKYRYPKLLQTRLQTFQNNGFINPDVDIKSLSSIISYQSLVSGIIEYAILNVRDVRFHLNLMKSFSQYICLGITRDNS